MGRLHRCPAMPSMPWFKFYPSDWIACGELLRCSWAARGLWVHMICVMHKSQSRGRLVGRDGARLDDATVLLMCGLGPDGEGLLRELEDAGVFERGADGEIVCRRMVRDASISESRSRAGRKGAQSTHGLPGCLPEVLPRQNGWQTVISPSSSSSLVGGGSGGGNDHVLTDADLEPTRLAYPRSAKPLRARASLRAAIARLSHARHGGVASDALAWLNARVRLYAQIRGKHNTHLIPYFHNWLDDGSYNEDDVEWRRQAKRPAGEHDGY